MHHPWIRLCCPDKCQQANHAKLVRYHPRRNVCHPACSDTTQRVTNHSNACCTVHSDYIVRGTDAILTVVWNTPNTSFPLHSPFNMQGRAKLPHPSCVNRKRCLNGTGVIRTAERSHHQATPGSPSSGCCSVLRQFYLQETWARLHWTCSCLLSSSSTNEKKPQNISHRSARCVARMGVRGWWGISVPWLTLTVLLSSLFSVASL